MPQCVCVRVKGGSENFLGQDSAGASEPGEDLAGVLAIAPKTRSWRFTSGHYAKPLHVRRTQVPLLPKRHCTLHGLQGRTAQPGLVAYWRFPKMLSKESQWLAHYVILSRPPRLANLLSMGLPSREILEGGPPESINNAFQQLFQDKIEETKLACQAAREELGWPPRRWHLQFGALCTQPSRR